MTPITLMIINFLIYIEKPGISYRYPEDSMVLA
jgi:hypothetical protein